VLHGQRVLNVGSLSIDDWPASIVYPLRAIAWVWSTSSPETLSADCILPAGNVPLSVQRLVFYLTMPIAMLLVLLVMEVVLPTGCSVLSRKMGIAHKLLPRLGSSAIVVLVFFLPSLLRTIS
jgi:hypothetical protein